MEIIRAVDRVKDKMIIVFVQDVGRVVVLEGKKYPKNGLAGMSKKGYDEAVEKALQKLK